MTAASRPVEVVRLGPEHREEVLDVLVEAFADYPVMRFVIGPEHRGDAARLRALIGFFVDVRLTMGWPVLGIREGTALVAATLVNEPTTEPFLSRFGEGLTRLRGELGPAAYGRLERFEQASEGNEPQEPHFFVGMLGVRRAWQGRGLGRRLLEAVRDMAREAGAPCIALSTEDERNVPFYRHLGLEVVGEADVESLHTWGFRWDV